MSPFFYVVLKSKNILSRCLEDISRRISQYMPPQFIFFECNGRSSVFQLKEEIEVYVQVERARLPRREK
jgi:hypothetical protein